MKRIADKRLVVDIETTLDHKTIWLCCTLDIDTGEKHTWYQAKAFQEYIADATLLIGHNLISFDAYLLNSLWKTKIVLDKCYDTLLVSRLLSPSLEGGHSLAAWGNTLGVQKIDYKATWQWLQGTVEEDCTNCDGTGVIYKTRDLDKLDSEGYNDEELFTVVEHEECPKCKGTGKQAPRSIREAYKGECYDKPHMGLLAVYCERDIDVTALLYHHLVAETEAQKFSQESVELEHAVAAIVAKQERNGFKLDIPYATVLLTTVKGKLDSIYESMQERWPPYTVERVSEKTGKPLKPATVVFNPGSRQQIGDKLIELGWEPTTFTPTGQPIVDEGSLAGCKLPEALLISEYLMLQKRVAQIESWLEAVEDDGRVHGRVTTNGAVTGRMTHSGPNMAQIPNSGSVFGPECRECWSVDEGNVLVGADASGLELRMLAHYMKDDNYVATVVNGSSEDGTDVHSVNQRAAGLSTRADAKTFIYAFLYGAGNAKIGSIVGGSAKAGGKLKEKFLQQTPALRKLIDAVASIAAGGSVPGLDGRRIWVRSEHAALNSLLQSAGAIVMKKALVLFDAKIRHNKWPVKIVANVHDEWQWETKESYAKITGEAAVQSIVEAGEFYKLRCPLNGEYKYGKSWRETH
jgi:DNA polymerase-1